MFSGQVVYLTQIYRFCDPEKGQNVLLSVRLCTFFSEKLDIIIGESLKIELSRIIVLDLVTLFSQPVNRNTVERS